MLFYSLYYYVYYASILNLDNKTKTYFTFTAATSIDPACRVLEDEPEFDPPVNRVTFNTLSWFVDWIRNGLELLPDKSWCILRHASTKSSLNTSTLFSFSSSIEDKKDLNCVVFDSELSISFILRGGL